MSKVALVTDSTAYFPDEMVKEFGLTITPQVLIWGDETFRDGVDIMPQEFYHRLKHTKVMPTTSQVAIVDMKAAFEKLLEAGYDVLGMFLSSKLSGTMNSATQAKELLPKAKDKLVLVDTESAAMAMGFQVLAVARAARDGASFADCQKLAVEAIKHTGVFFVVDTLEFLHRGGRMSGTQALLGSALKIKPVLTLKDGAIVSADKVRTKKKATERMIDLVVESIGSRTPVRLASLHANAEHEARRVLETASARLHPVETVFSTVSPAIGTHIGPGTIGLAYMAGM